MMQLHHDIDKFEKKKIKIVAICPEKLSSVEKFFNENKLSFDLISDPNHMLADRYNQQVKILKLGRMPAQIILKENSEIELKHFANSMKDIVENDEILSKF